MPRELWILLGEPTVREAPGTLRITKLPADQVSSLAQLTKTKAVQVGGFIKIPLDWGR